MASETQSLPVLRFGTYEVDLRAGELRKQGKRVKLQEQPFQVLAVLLQRPGEVVTREELRKQIWPEDTFVDFDNGLNTAVNKLREALGDSADNPRFVETLPRRGYRFLAPVTGDGKRTAPTPRAASGVTKLRTRWGILIGGVALILVVGLILVGLSRLDSTRGRINSIAVIPFANGGGDPDAEYLSDGITEGIIDKLSGLPNIKVISRTSAFRYKKREIEPRKVAKELGVQALVTGRVVQRGNGLTVSVELLDAREDKHLWGEQYRPKPGDIFSVQRQIATAITVNLGVHLTSGEKKQLAKAYSANAESYRLYLKGRYFWSKNTLEDLQNGIEYFQQAIEKDPGNAQAYAGLANCYNYLGGGMAYLPPKENFAKAKAAARKALELDDTLAEAHTALGWVNWGYEWDWSSAEREFLRAIELDPNSAVAHDRYATFLGTMGRFEDSVAEGQRAGELDPLSQSMVGFLGYEYRAAGRYDESIAQLKKAIELDPSAAWAHAFLGWTYARKGMYAEAIAEHERMGPQAYAVSGENQVIASGLGWVYALAGKRDEATRVLEAFRKLPSQTYVDFYQVGAIYAGLGNKDRAFQELEKGYAERSGSMVYIKTDPFWDEVHSDPRYTDLLRRMGLPQ